MMEKKVTNGALEALAKLRRLRDFDGEPGEFWRQYAEGVAEVCDASASWILIRRPDGGWVTVMRWPRNQASAGTLEDEVLNQWLELAKEAPACVEITGETRRVAAVLAGPDGAPAGLVVVELPDEGGTEAEDAVVRLGLSLGLPGHFEQRRLLHSTQQDAGRLASALDLMAMLNGETEFVSAGMLLCNELASRFSCDRVGLGWLESNVIAVRALSHTEKIEPRMEAVQQLAAAMEEAVDQEEEILHPRPTGQSFVTHSHEAFAKSQGTAFLATLPVFEPLISEQEPGTTPRPVGAVTLERAARTFTITELRTLRLMLDQAARPMAELHRNDKWFGARWLAAVRKWASKLLGAEHTWWKLLAGVLALALLILIFGRKNYTVEGGFTTKTDAMAHLAVPFDGHIEKALAQPGDAVKSGQPLVTLDVRELLLQKEAAVAERGRHAADALKAESSGDVAGMRIAQARGEQARVQWQMVVDRLAKAEIKAPFDGVVVEGDLRERISAPVQKGDLLLKVGRIEDLYLIAEVAETDIQEIRAGGTGQAAFASQPGRKFAFTVERIEPVARSKEKGSTFAVHGRFTEAAPDWWRPGMSGVAKIDVGSRSLFWIYTHKTADFLRMWWW